MRILYVVHQFYPEYYSGTERFVFNLASMMQKAGHFVKIVTYTFLEGEGFESRGGILAKEYTYKSIPIVGIRHAILPADFDIACGNQDIYNYAVGFFKEEGTYDLLHIAHPLRLISFAQAAMGFKLPYMITFTDFWAICPKIILKPSKGYLCDGPEGGKTCRNLCPELPHGLVNGRLSTMREIVFNAGSLIAPSMFLASKYKKEWPELDITLIPHSIDFKYTRENQKIYRKGDKVIFGYCGTIQPHKGVHILIEAFMKLISVDARLKVYGDAFHEGEYFEKLKNMVKTDSRVEFCGSYNAEDVGEVLKGIDVLIIPSVCYESYSYTLHESLACNIPIIASNAGVMAEKVKDMITGFTFTLGDSEDLTRKMEHVIRAPEVLNVIKQRLVDHMPLRVEEEAFMYERLYGNVISSFIKQPISQRS